MLRGSCRSEDLQRLSVVPGAVLIQLALGAIYAWSVFARALEDAGWLPSATQDPFTVGLVTFALVMLFTADVMARIGPRLTTLAGAALLLLGYHLASLDGGTNYWLVVIGVGLLGGAGIGLGYVVPIAACMQWYPERKGLISGIAVAGFGGATILWVHLAGSWGGLLASQGIDGTFMSFGFLLGAVAALGGLMMSIPDRASAKAVAGRTVDFDRAEMLHTPQFYAIFATFVVAAMAGLMSIGLMKQFPEKALLGAGCSLEDVQGICEFAIVTLSIGNALGRCVIGYLSDRVSHMLLDRGVEAPSAKQRGKRLTLMGVLGLQGSLMLVFPYVAGYEYALYVVAFLVGMNFGANFTLFPTITDATFGSKHFAKNYALVFLAYALAGIIGPQLGGMMGDMGNYPLAFTIVGLLTLGGMATIALADLPTRMRDDHRMHAVA